MILQVDIVEDESTGKRTIKTASICWGNKLSLLVSTPFYDPRLLPNSKDPDLDFSQAQIEVNTEADWVKASTSLKSIPLKTLLMFCRVCNSIELVVPLLLHCSYPNASSPAFPAANNNKAHASMSAFTQEFAQENILMVQVAALHGKQYET